MSEHKKEEEQKQPIIEQVQDDNESHIQDSEPTLEEQNEQNEPEGTSPPRSEIHQKSDFVDDDDEEEEDDGSGEYETYDSESYETYDSEEEEEEENQENEEQEDEEKEGDEKQSKENQEEEKQKEEQEGDEKQSKENQEEEKQKEDGKQSKENQEEEKQKEDQQEEEDEKQGKENQEKEKQKDEQQQEDDEQKGDENQEDEQRQKWDEKQDNPKASHDDDDKQDIESEKIDPLQKSQLIVTSVESDQKDVKQPPKQDVIEHVQQSPSKQKENVDDQHNTQSKEASQEEKVKEEQKVEQFDSHESKKQVEDEDKIQSGIDAKLQNQIDNVDETEAESKVDAKNQQQNLVESVSQPQVLLSEKSQEEKEKKDEKAQQSNVSLNDEATRLMNIINAQDTTISGMSKEINQLKSRVSTLQKTKQNNQTQQHVVSDHGPSVKRVVDNGKQRKPKQYPKKKKSKIAIPASPIVRPPVPQQQLQQQQQQQERRLLNGSGENGTLCDTSNSNNNITSGVATTSSSCDNSNQNSKKRYVTNVPKGKDVTQVWVRNNIDVIMNFEQNEEILKAMKCHIVVLDHAGALLFDNYDIDYVNYNNDLSLYQIKCDGIVIKKNVETKCCYVANNNNNNDVDPKSKLNGARCSQCAARRVDSRVGFLVEAIDVDSETYDKLVENGGGGGVKTSGRECVVKKDYYVLVYNDCPNELRYLAWKNTCSFLAQMINQHFSVEEFNALLADNIVMSFGAGGNKLTRDEVLKYLYEYEKDLNQVFCCAVDEDNDEDDDDGDNEETLRRGVGGRNKRDNVRLHHYRYDHNGIPVGQGYYSTNGSNNSSSGGSGGRKSKVDDSIVKSRSGKGYYPRRSSIVGRGAIAASEEDEWLQFTKREIFQQIDLKNFLFDDNTLVGNVEITVTNKTFGVPPLGKSDPKQEMIQGFYNHKIKLALQDEDEIPPDDDDENGHECSTECVSQSYIQDEAIQLEINPLGQFTKVAFYWNPRQKLSNYINPNRIAGNDPCEY